MMPKYCCNRFQETVKEQYIIKSRGLDETAWHLKGWLHIYYCPFCGTNTKGKGYGEFDIDIEKQKRKRTSRIRP
jgi:hypothetical protein